MYISASAPEAPPLSETTIGCFIRLFFWIAACIMRAIWSEAPPAPAATTISTGLVGSQAAMRRRAREHGRQRGRGFDGVSHVFHPYVLVRPGCIAHGLLGAIVRAYEGEFKQVQAALLMTLA